MPILLKKTKKQVKFMILRFNWGTDIKWDDEETAQTLEEMYLPEQERFFSERKKLTREN